MAKKQTKSKPTAPDGAPPGDMSFWSFLHVHFNPRQHPGVFPIIAAAVVVPFVLWKLDLIRPELGSNRISVAWGDVDAAAANAAPMSRYKSGEALPVHASLATTDSRAWVQALITDLGFEAGHTIILASSEAAPSAYEGFTLSVRPAAGGSVSGYALRCADSDKSGRCEILGDRFDAPEPLVRVPRMDARDYLLLIVKVGARQVQTQSKLNDVLKLEVQ